MQVGDLVIVKEYYKDESRKALVVSGVDGKNRGLIYKIIFLDNINEYTFITPNMVNVISEKL